MHSAKSVMLSATIKIHFTDFSVKVSGKINALKSSIIIKMYCVLFLATICFHLFCYSHIFGLFCFVRCVYNNLPQWKHCRLTARCKTALMLILMLSCTFGSMYVYLVGSVTRGSYSESQVLVEELSMSQHNDSLLMLMMFCSLFLNRL